MASRLRTGEWCAALGGVLLLVSLFALHWYGPAFGHAGWWSYPPSHPRAGFRIAGFHLSLTGWRAIPTLRWFALITGLFGLALAIAQAVRGPGLAVTLDLIGMLVAGLTTILVAIRLATTAAPLRFGAVLGLFAAGLVMFGAFRSLRTEQGWIPDPADPQRTIEVVELGSADGA